ncbi:GNAT family N-acetyltransferase [Kribbella sp. NPDC000426]|uniref:GNAT family N-acetyltransferase n=1 Tax=Kribbella sp. NPDC000426 TaxID=3154255 RepID=UPI003326A943
MTEPAEAVSTLDQAERLLRLGAVRIEPTDATSPDACTCLTNYADELRGRFPEGFADEDLISPADTVLFLVARESGTPVGCAALSQLDDDTCELRHLWVHSSARSIGLGRRLLTEVERHAADQGFGRLRLGTHKVLTEADNLYRSAGYHETKSYGGATHTHRWFTKQLGR